MKTLAWWKWLAALFVAILIGWLIAGGAREMLAGIVAGVAGIFGFRNVGETVKEEADAKAKEIQGRGTTVRNADILDRLRNGPPKTGS